MMGRPQQVRAVLSQHACTRHAVTAIQRALGPVHLAALCWVGMHYCEGLLLQHSISQMCMQPPPLPQLHQMARARLQVDVIPPLPGLATQ